jgi:hypothetical protein
MALEDDSNDPAKVNPFARQLLKQLSGPSNVNPKAIQRWAKDLPHSVLNLVGDELLEQAALAIDEELLAMSEMELASKCGPGRPARVDRRVRIQFWDEYENAAKLMKPMNLKKVVEETGADSWQGYREQLTSRPGLLAWFMNPPAGYRIQMREAQELGLARLMDILEMDNYTMSRDGKKKVANVGVMAIQMMAFKLIDARNNGAITQKMVSLSASMGPIPDELSKLSQEEMNKKIAELEAIIKPDPKPILEVYKVEAPKVLTPPGVKKK